MHERILEEFLLRAKDKDQIRNFFADAPLPAKTGYLKGYYKTGITIIDGYYVEFNPSGIEIARDEKVSFTWRQVAEKIDELIARGKYGKREPTVTTCGRQMSIFDYGGTP